MTTPVNLLEIIEIVGEPAALKLVEACGGQTVRIPALRNVNTEHPLAQHIGVESLTTLAKSRGGSWLYIARCYRGMIDRRNRAIVEAYGSGVPVSELVRQHGISDRRIWDILKFTVVDDRQESLF